ncbi:DUF1653 domain-containing protein [Bovifimicola ammoniilytica]|uniref:DUF1653 domain-containing protein n=1 Tax=Bovifimicola ammoniilytica TaxID=2981720 RepID=UPI000821D203|nr:DUF1653 domain-containing protein [Bovifimicola ammoniilytica]MCU6752672.1 DUF1653 domain-containing protein [Bovifimicola ammoniilytica]SCJ32822.1 Uncharacterized protein conserved in bacteria [uncultured Eubacterium sp.]
MKEAERVIYPGQIYRHFKGNLYQIVTVAIHSESGEKLVIYQKLYGDYAVHARPYDMFLSEVDRQKYPDIKQKYRFELVDNEIKSNQNVDAGIKESINLTDDIIINDTLNTDNIESVDSEESADKRLIKFLDADTFEEKRRVLINIKDGITDRLIDDMAAAIDVTVDEGDIDTRFMSLLNCINTRAKYEVNRLR